MVTTEREDLLMLARSHRTKGRIEDAEYALQRLLALAPAWWPGHAAFAELCLAQRDTETALRHADRARSLAPVAGLVLLYGALGASAFWGVVGSAVRVVLGAFGILIAIGLLMEAATWLRTRRRRALRWTAAERSAAMGVRCPPFSPGPGLRGRRAAPLDCYGCGSKPQRMMASNDFRLPGIVAALLTLSLVSGEALAGDDPDICALAGVTYDGRYAVLLPGCAPARAFDLTTGALVDPAGHGPILAQPTLPLRHVPSTDRFGRWAFAERHGQNAIYQWATFDVLGTGWLLRYRSRGPSGGAGRLSGEVQYAPRDHLDQLRRTRQLPDRPPLPAIGPLGGPPADLAGVFELVGARRVRRKLQERKYTYDPKRFRELVPTVAHLWRHGTCAWRYIGSDGSATGFECSDWAESGLWAALGHPPGSGPFRLVGYRQGRTYRNAWDEPHAIWEALFQGRAIVFRTYRPFEFTRIVLTPRSADAPTGGPN